MTDSSAAPILTHNCATPDNLIDCRTVTFLTDTIRTSTSSPARYTYQYAIYLSG